MNEFDKVIDRKNTYCTQWDFTKDRFGKVDILPFSISDTDFQIPKEAREVLQQKIEHGIFGYSRWQHEDFLNSVVGWYARRFDYRIDAKWINYSPTVIFSLSQLIQMKSVKKSVLLFTPAYDAFFGVLASNNCEQVYSQFSLVDDKFVIDRHDFEKKIKTVDVMILCSPHNPVGKVFTEEELIYIVNTCKQNNVFIISDEIHMDIVFGKKHIPLLKVTDKLNYSFNSAIITSATKTFNFPGLLFSYVLLPDQKLKENFQLQLKHKYGLSSCTITGLITTITVYNDCDVWVDKLNEYLSENYLLCKKFFAENNLNLTIHQFDATYLLWIDAQYYQKDFERLVHILHTEVDLGIMNGDVYKMSYYLRLNIGCSQEKLMEGLRRLKLGIELLEKQD